MKRKNFFSGFTLIELLIVVVIIGILATFAVPEYAKSVERARVGKAKNALALVIKAEKMYMADKDGSISTDIRAGLNSYIEMNEICTGTSGCSDDAWNYSVAANGTATATRENGPTAYNGNTITLDTNGNWGGDHPLK